MSRDGIEDCKRNLKRLENVYIDRLRKCVFLRELGFRPNRYKIDFLECLTMIIDDLDKRIKDAESGEDS